MKSIWPAVVSLLLILLTGCSNTPPILSIGLLGPFEGRHRQQGYEALYAVRLALTDSGTDYHLLALDDGGTLESAQQRAAALALDQSIIHVLLVGELANHSLVKKKLTQPFTSVQMSEAPDEAFRQRYLASAQYAPVPDALALASYYATMKVIKPDHR